MIEYKYIGQYGEVISPINGQYYKHDQTISEVEYYKVSTYHRNKFVRVDTNIFEYERRWHEDSLIPDILDTAIGLSVLDSVLDSTSSLDSDPEPDSGGFEGGGGDFGGGGSGGEW